VLLAVVVGVLVTVEQSNLVNIAATIALVLLTVVFVLECWKCRPGKMKLLVERNIAIWQQVIGAKGSER
jgi:hypothetical protein